LDCDKTRHPRVLRTLSLRGRDAPAEVSGTCLVVIPPRTTMGAEGWVDVFSDVLWDSPSDGGPARCWRTIELAINILAFERDLMQLCNGLGAEGYHNARTSIMTYNIIILYLPHSYIILYNFMRSNFNYLYPYLFIYFISLFFSSLRLCRNHKRVILLLLLWLRCCTSNRHRGVYCIINNTIYLLPTYYYIHTYFIIIITTYIYIININNWGHLISNTHIFWLHGT